MRGGISYQDVMDMTPIERQILSEFIKKQLEIMQKNPFSRL